MNAGEGSGTTACLSADRHTITLDGVDPRQEDLTCFGADQVATRGRIYLLDLFSKVPLTSTDRATFDRFLSSFEFRAATAS